MGIYRKLSRWPHYIDNPEVLEMSGPEYSRWYKENVWFAPTRFDEMRARRAAETPEERRERRRTVASVAAFLAAGVLKVAAVLSLGFVAGVFGAANAGEKKTE